MSVNMKSVEEMMLPPPPASPYWKDVEEKRRTESLEVKRSPFRDSLASKERRYQQERTRVSRSTDYKAELNRLLGKAAGTPYEETLRKLIEGKSSSRGSNISSGASLAESDEGYNERGSFVVQTTPGMPPRSPPRTSQQSRVI